MTPIIHAVIFLFAGFFLYWFVIPKDWRNKFLFAASIYFISLFGIQYAVYFVFNTFLVYIAGRYIRSGAERRSLVVKLMLIWLIGSLGFVKYIHLLLNSVFKLGAQFALMPETIFNQLVLPMGFSYIIFRLIHYIVETYRKKLPEHSFWDLGLYVLFFPTFLAGPIDRFERVQPQTAEKKDLSTFDINYGLFRIISGMIKKFIISDAILMPLIIPLLNSPQDASRIFVILAVYGLAVQLYMDFAGYTDMAIGVARLFGYEIMENFNRPFFQKNIAMFWRNFHISFYNFVRDYFFLPLFGYRASQLKIYIGIFLTMVVTCLRHEGNLHWLILGIYYGLGLVVWQAFQEVKRKNPRIRKMIDNRYADPVSIFLTFSFFSFGLIAFYYDIPGAKNILYKVFLQV